MLSRVIRTAAVSALCLGGTFMASSAAFAQETTTTVAAVATETTVAAAVVAETVAAEPAAAEPVVAEATPAAAPEGAVAAAGGFLSTDGNNTLPIVLAGAALVTGAGLVIARRRKA